jgi:hypothetical protein
LWKAVFKDREKRFGQKLPKTLFPIDLYATGFGKETKREVMASLFVFGEF